MLKMVTFILCWSFYHEQQQQPNLYHSKEEMGERTDRCGDLPELGESRGGFWAGPQVSGLAG